MDSAEDDPPTGTAAAETPLVDETEIVVVTVGGAPVEVRLPVLEPYWPYWP